jgi:hypothetical protein
MPVTARNQRGHYAIATHADPDRRGRAWDMAALAVATAPLWLFLGADIAAHVPAASEWLSGPTTANNKPNYVRNFLELTSFLATTAVLLTGAFALVFTLTQLREVRHARVATTYISINAKYNEPLMRNARKTIKRLYDSWTFLRREDEELGDYVARHFARWAALDTSTPEYLLYNECMRVMEFWEDVAVLVRRRFVDADVVFDFHLSAVQWAESIFARHVRNRRADSGNLSLYANALWLMRKAHDATPYAYHD